MNEDNDGGPAFPVLDTSYEDRDNTTHYDTVGGMSIRDYLAAHANEKYVLHYMCSDGKTEPIKIIRTSEQAKYAYADQMIEARKS